MKYVKPSYEVLDRRDKLEIYEKIERIARVCYKSEDKIGPGTAEKMVRMLVERGHYAMLEHASVSVLWTVSRSVSHAMVRHRIGSFAQESTQYCDYTSGRFGGDVAFIEYEPWDDADAQAVRQAYGYSEYAYKELRGLGFKPVVARDVLASGLKTELVTTFDLTQWCHFFEMRDDGADSPQMRSIVHECYDDFRAWMPEVFANVVPFTLKMKRERELPKLIDDILDSLPRIDDSDPIAPELKAICERAKALRSFR